MKIRYFETSLNTTFFFKKKVRIAVQVLGMVQYVFRFSTKMYTLKRRAFMLTCKVFESSKIGNTKRLCNLYPIFKFLLFK